jgi:hypothetical protein
VFSLLTCVELCVCVRRYEGLKGVARRLEDNDEAVTKKSLFVCGALAGTVGQVVAYPIDTIRRRMQVQGFGPATYQYGGSIRATMKQIVREEGIQGLYKGMTANLCKVAPAVSISFVTVRHTACHEPPPRQLSSSLYLHTTPHVSLCVHYCCVWVSTSTCESCWASKHCKSYRVYSRLIDTN